jgi:bifunctional non-homologous end joining protein LigD
MGLNTVTKKRYSKSTPGVATTEMVKVNDHVVKLTNQQKVYWPDEGYTKGDVIRYYGEMADYILPYLKDRPQSLERNPNGNEKQ